MAAKHDPTRELANFLADDANWAQRVDHTLRSLANGQNRLMGDMAAVKASVEKFPQLVAEAAAENRQYYRRLQTRLDDELGTDYDDVSGSHDVRSLRDAGRTWRKRAREQEEAAAAAAATAKEKAEAVERWKRRGVLLGALLLGAGGVILKAIEALAK
jgi:hypothetical protein